MVSLINNILLFKYKRIWFPSIIPKVGLFDFVSLRQCKKEIAENIDTKEWIKINFTTLHNNLLEDESVLFSKIAKNTKYEINRASKEGVEITKTNLKEFLVFFNAFAPTKHLKKLRTNNLKAYKDSLLITKSFRDEVVFAMHAYVVDKDEGRARLLYSATVNRNTSNIDLNMIGRANRLLHWKDMLMFKDEGLSIYDWGGIVGDKNAKETQGIDSFKMAYGGIPIQEAHYEHKKLNLLKKLLKR
ncbi:MAG: hypothetical protein ACTTJ3_03055 [Treponema sp.]